MNRRSALLGTSTGVWNAGQRRPMLDQLMAPPNTGLVKGDTITIPVDEFVAAAGDVMACPSVHKQAGGAEPPRE